MSVFLRLSHCPAVSFKAALAAFTVLCCPVPGHSDEGGSPRACRVGGCGNCPQGFLYVKCDAAGSGDGLSWETAFNSLHHALSVAVAGVEIWVAAGTCYPVDCAPNCDEEDRRATFRLKAGVSLYGGFAGDEDSCEDRTLGGCDSNSVQPGRACSQNDDCVDDDHPNATCLAPMTTTVLSGDLEDDDAPELCAQDTDCDGVVGGLCINGSCIKQTNISENSYHVVTYDLPDAEVVLDGFIIRRGSADGTTVKDNQGSAVNIRRRMCQGGSNDGNPCWTTNTDCPDGTCVSPLCISGGPTIRNCVIEYNFSSDHGAVNDHGSTTTIENCLFRFNAADKAGAALLIDNGSAVVRDCIFENNATTALGGEGGAVWVAARSSETGCPASNTPSIVDCALRNNVSQEGGAIWARDAGLTIRDTMFKFNRALETRCSSSYCTAPCTEPVTARGGAVFFENARAPSIIETSVFDSNESTHHGGAVFLIETSAQVPQGPAIVGCEFVENKTPPVGDCPGNLESEGILIGYIFTGGAGLWIEDYATSVTVDNCVFERNRPPGLAQFAGALWLEDNANVLVKNCRILGNKSAYGGGVYQLSSSVFYLNTLLVNNVVTSNGRANSIGGGLLVSGTSHAELVNCDVLFNVLVENDEGGGVHVGSSSTAEVINSILWGNLAGQNVVDPTADAQIFRQRDCCSGGNFSCCEEENACNVANDTSCDVHHSIWHQFSGSLPGVSDADPEFVCEPSPGADRERGTPDDYYGDLRLCIDSPAIDAGDNDAVPKDITTDITRITPRILDGDLDGTDVVDIGAYELDPTCQDQSDCPCTGQTCSEGICISGCFVDEDCVAGTCCEDCVCCDGVCIPGCCSDEDCQPGDVCCDQTCISGDCCIHDDCDPWLCCGNTCQDVDCCTGQDCGFSQCCLNGTCWFCE